MHHELIPPHDQDLVRHEDQALTIGELANTYAARSVFTDYQSRLAENTRKRQQNDLALFSRFLAQAGILISAQDLYSTPSVWQAITYGLLEAFVRWQLAAGYAIGSINVHL